jgi:hypothetical protein
MASRDSKAGWTVETLHEHLIARLDAQEKLGEEREARNLERFANANDRVIVAMASSEKAITKAEIATDKRFDGVNELRGALSDQATLMLPRTEYTTQHQSLIEKIDDLKDRLGKLNLTNWSAIGGYIVGAVGVIAVIVEVLTRH